MPISNKEALYIISVMTNLLRRLFIKDYKNVSDPEVRKKHGYLASCVGLTTNLILVVFKILIGVITASVSIIADGINNLSDMASSIINFLGFKLANKPADKKHPFGHERIEYITGLIISFIIIAIAVVLGYTSIQKIVNHESANPNMYTFIILGASIIIKLWQGLFYRKIGKTINSLSIKANSLDSLSDAISTTVVLIGAIIEYCCHINIDGYMGLAVSLFIIVMGIKLVIETSNPLIGVSPDNELVKTIVNDISSYEGVLGTHDMMCHCYGPTKIFMTIHVEVDAKVSALTSHELIDFIETDISKKHNVILTIHMDPIETESEEINKLRDFISNILNIYNKDYTYHDLRIVSGEKQINVLFDVVVPFNDNSNKESIHRYLNDEFKKLDEKYHLVIKIENQYHD